MQVLLKAVLWLLPAICTPKLFQSGHYETRTRTTRRDRVVLSTIQPSGHYLAHRQDSNLHWAAHIIYPLPCLGDCVSRRDSMYFAGMIGLEPTTVGLTGHCSQPIIATSPYITQNLDMNRLTLDLRLSRKGWVNIATFYTR